MKNKKDYIAKAVPFEKDLDGLSKDMLNQHFKLYEGYVGKSNEIQKEVDEVDKSDANGTYSIIGELKRQETFAVNGMKLHDVYFSILGGDGESKGILKELIEKDFGSIDLWKEEMVATGMSSRGWAVLAYDFRDDRLHIYGADAHNIGAVWGAVPLIPLDVYEHSYAIDYGISRKDYIDSFFKNLDWDKINEMIIKWQLDKIHQG